MHHLALRWRKSAEHYSIAGVGVHARLLQTWSWQSSTRTAHGEMAATRSPSLDDWRVPMYIHTVEDTGTETMIQE
jgi:hypothetical protein